jgi:hypothetical protein
MACRELVANTSNTTIECNITAKSRSYKCVDVIKRGIKETRWEGVAWIGVSQDMVQKRAVANTALKFDFQKLYRNVSTFSAVAAQLAASQGELSSTKRLAVWGGSR